MDHGCLNVLIWLLSVCFLCGSTIGSSGHYIKFFPIQQSDQNTTTCYGFIENDIIFVRGEAKVNGYSDTSIQIVIHKHFQSSNQFMICEIELKSKHATQGCSYNVTEKENVFTFTVTIQATKELSFGKISGNLLNNKEIKGSHQIDLPGIYEEDQANVTVVINEENMENQSYLIFSDKVLSISVTCQSLLGSCHLQLRLNDTPTLLETEDKLKFEASYPQPRYVSIILAVYSCCRSKVLKRNTYDVLIGSTQHYIKLFPLQESKQNTSTCKGYVENDIILVRGEANVNGLRDSTILIIIQKQIQFHNEYTFCKIELKSKHATQGCSYNVTEKENVFSFAATITATKELSFGKISGYLLKKKGIKSFDEMDLTDIYEEDQVNVTVVINQQNVEDERYLNFTDEFLNISATCQSLLGSCHLQLRLNDTPTLLKSDDELLFEASYLQPRYVSIILTVYNCNRSKVLKICTYDVLVAQRVKTSEVAAVIIGCVLYALLYPCFLISGGLFRRNFLYL